MKNEFIAYVPVLETHNAGDRVFLKSILDAEGITYYIQGEYVAPYLFNALPMRLMVKKEQADKAREILKDIELSYSYGGGKRPETESLERDDPYQDLVRSLDKARDFLNRGDAGSALKVLEAFAARDIRGVHTAHPEFYKLLGICQQALGLDTRNTIGRIAEMKLDWLTALKKGEQLLKAGKVKESIAFFKRSLSGNPGEAGTASAEQAARQGIKAAEALLKQQK